MKQLPAQWLDRTSTVYIAAAVSLAIGLFFTFVWAPHPWGWQGIDQYHDLATGLARGEPFATTDVPWGYAYFAAAFYWLFGNRIWVPVTAQVFINAAAPLLLYHLVRPLASQRVAVLSAVITGAFSFNNLYASTQASDALCTILFLAALLTLARAIETERIALFAVSGLLAGLVPQFRPNLVLLPVMFVVGYVLYHRTARQVRDMLVYGALVAVALSPWIIRNYRLTGLFLPTSTHGGVQLWYGTLQVGPYLESRAHNPRSIFESAPFNYTSLANTPLFIDVDGYTCTPPPALAYWTDRDPRRISARPENTGGRQHRYVLPGQPDATAVYYYFHATQSSDDGPVALFDPPGGERNPYVWFVDDDHLGNVDRHDDVLDVFDLIALARQLTGTGPAAVPRLDLDGDGGLSQADLERAISSLLPEGLASPILTALTVDAGHVTMRLSDGSTIIIPDTWQGRHTDLEVQGNIAGALISRSRTFSSLRATPTISPYGCRLVETVRVNDRFYRREPHFMRRYMALALDNISRDPWAFVAASAYRAVRLFIIRGSVDPSTAQQFSASRAAYAAGTVLSTMYFLVFLAGAWIAWRQRSALLWLLVPIVYVPLTICFVLTNMRYTVTMQPLMFVFVALTVVTVLRWEPPINTD